MKIIVPIKQILDPRGVTIRRDKERMFINREEYILDPGSKAALEAALCLQDAGHVETLMALSLGPARADDALREALALGCDQAFLLCDPAFEAADASTAARILATAIDKLGGADLILTGNRSGDTASGQTGPRLAQALGYAQVTEVWALDLDGHALQATRRWGSGFAAVAVSPPAVITVSPEAFPLRYAHGARIMNAYREWSVTTWSAKDLDLDPAALAPRLTLRSEGFAPPLEIGEILSGDPEEAGRDLIVALRQQGLIK